MKRTILTIAVALLMGCTAHAQTVKWLVKPQYASITHYSNDIFKCIGQNGELQLLDWEGKPLLENIDFNAVTEYSDGYAIVLKDNRILGFLSEDGSHNFQFVSGDYYATKYSFFSEGYVVVAKGSAGGKQGYMDSKGSLALECRYLEAMPVRQGWAVVKKDGTDKTKNYAYLSVGDWHPQNGVDALGDFIWATSFNEEGLALAKGKKGKKYGTFDTKFKLQKINVNGNKDENKKQFVNSYDYSYKPEGSQEVEPPTNAKPAKNEEYYIEEFVHAQFNDAQGFYNRRAIVSLGDGYGIIELLDGKFETNWPAEKIRVYEYTNEVDPLQFTLAVPASLENGKVKLELDKGDGRFEVCNGLSLVFEVANQVIRSKRPDCEIKAKAIYCDNGFPDLLLWEDKQTVGIDYISLNLSSPVVTSEYADENDNQTVKAVVTNTSDVAVKVSATLNVAGRSAPFNGVLKPNQSQIIKVTVKVDNDKQVQATVSAKVDKHDCGSKSSYVSLKKI